VWVRRVLLVVLAVVLELELRRVQVAMAAGVDLEDMDS
jgi:hypothetical protein